MAFLFWKKKRGVEGVEPAADNVEQPVQNKFSDAINASSEIISEPKVETPAEVQKPEVASAPEKPAGLAEAKPAELEAVELPKRSAKKGIRSLLVE